MKRNNKAFTLVEMLIVVVIIGILAAALIPRLMGAQGQTRDAARKIGVGQIQTGLEVYFGREGDYPQTSGGAAIESTEKLAEFISGDMAGIPKDQQVQKKSKNIQLKDSTPGYWGYFYGKNASGTPSYVISSNVENVKAGNLVIGNTAKDIGTAKTQIAKCTGILSLTATDAECKPANVTEAYYALGSSNN